MCSTIRNDLKYNISPPSISLFSGEKYSLSKTSPNRLPSPPCFHFFCEKVSEWYEQRRPLFGFPYVDLCKRYIIK